MSRILTVLFALGAGAAVGNLYWTQPLLDLIARDLRVAPASAGWLVTGTQVGYAVGVLLLVPLGDLVSRRVLVPLTMTLSAASLVACAVAPSIGLLLGAVALLGGCTVAGQLLTPLAGDLADDALRGRVVGTVASGMVTGILLSRVISGLLADVAGWRSVFAAAAVLDVVLAALLLWRIPTLEPRVHLRYPALLASVVATVGRVRAVRWTLALGATGFGLFTMFWTALTLLLSSPPFGYPAGVIGLFGIAGLAGAIAAQRAGRLHDRGLALPATGLAWVGLFASFLLAGFAGRSVILLAVVTVLLDAATQTSNLLNQARMLAVSDTARSRLNTLFVVGNFVGGAVGSAAAAALWALAGWTAVAVAGAAMSVLGLGIWAVGRRGPLLVAAPAGHEAAPTSTGGTARTRHRSRRPRSAGR